MKALIILAFIFSACSTTKPCPDTAEIAYGIKNKDRDFGSSPEKWAAGIWVMDSAGVKRFWLLTESEVLRLNDRADKNLSDR